MQRCARWALEEEPPDDLAIASKRVAQREHSRWDLTVTIKNADAQTTVVIFLSAGLPSLGSRDLKSSMDTTALLLNQNKSDRLTQTPVT